MTQGVQIFFSKVVFRVANNLNWSLNTIKWFWSLNEVLLLLYWDDGSIKTINGNGVKALVNGDGIKGQVNDLVW